MKLPENVVPMPAEQRAELKLLAEAATKGSLEVGTTRYESKGELVHALDCETEVYPGPDCNEAGPLAIFGKPEDAEYFAACRPDVALATLAYVEALEAALEVAESYVPGKATPAALLAQLLGHLDSDGLDFVYDKLTRRCPLGKQQSDALATATQELAAVPRQLQMTHDSATWAMQDQLAEARAALVSARQELGDQEVKKLRLIEEAAADVQDLSRQISEAHTNTSQWITECGKRTEGRKKAERALHDFQVQVARRLAAEMMDPARCFTDTGKDWATENNRRFVLIIEQLGLQFAPINAEAPDAEPAAPAQVAAEPPAACCEKWHPGEAEKELADVQQQLARAEKVLEQMGIIVGRYEVTGLPVYDSDDYETDNEGCYLSRAEANELLEDEKCGGGLPLERGADAGPLEQGRIDCPSCGESLAWDNAWAGTGSACKHCGYSGGADAPEAGKGQAGE